MVGAGSAVGGGRRNAGPILAEAAGKLLSTPAGPRIAPQAGVQLLVTSREPLRLPAEPFAG